VNKPGTGLRFADVLIIEEGELGGRSPRVETLSFKSRDLAGLGEDALEAQMIADAKEALSKYGVSVRRTAPPAPSTLALLRSAESAQRQAGAPRRPCAWAAVPARP
jgi:hypothetical protein